MKVASLILFFAMILLVSKLIRLVQRGEMTFTQSSVWFIIWLSMGFFAIFPAYIDAIMSIFSMQRREFFVTFGALFIIYFEVFNIYCERNRDRKRIEKLTQEIAILNFKFTNPDIFKS